MSKTLQNTSLTLELNQKEKKYEKIILYGIILRKNLNIIKTEGQILLLILTTGTLDVRHILMILNNGLHILVLLKIWNLDGHTKTI